ncbi:MAG: flagella basal body P-ring formation protein FlgA [Terracidiphilus sp.]|jgi:hypothetical protein
MTRLKSIVATMSVVCLAMPALAVTQHYGIRAESVAAAMNGVGMQITPAQVALLTDVVATSSAPRLRVSSIEKLGDHRLMARVECQNPQECMPFFVRINLGPDTGASAPSGQSRVSFSSAGQAKPDAVKAGSKATLLLDSAHMHISLSVVCLENGAAGQKIRVSAGERRQIYLAEVINGQLLKGSL